MAINKIDISLFRGRNSSTYTGRDQGREARRILEINLKDVSEDDYVVEIPKGTTSFNPSFFLGLFYDSIKSLSIEKFNEKYQIVIADDNEEVKAVLLNNIDDAKRYALNEINNQTGFKRFFKKS